MSTKNLEFCYRKDETIRKATWLSIPIEHRQEAKIYPDMCRLKSEPIYCGSELECYQIAPRAQRLILFTDALGLHSDRLGKNLNYSFYGCAGMDHLVYFTGGKKERVILDSPYQKVELSPGYGDFWRSIWLPRSSDPYFPGVTHGRLSIHNSSTANLEELVERVSHLNFDLLSFGTTSEEPPPKETK